MEHFRFDFNGSPDSFKRTSQGFLRIKARLSKTGVFRYDTAREYRPEAEVFRADSLESLKGAPVTDLHPSEKGSDRFLTPANAKEHIIGLTESIEREGDYLKGSLIIFHEDAIKAIEAGERKEISLGYKCELDPTPGTWNSEPYDAVQKNIIINHVAIGPTGWGRAGADCSIRTDSQPPTKEEKKMSETIRLDGIDVALTPDSIAALFAQRKKQYEDACGRLDAIGLELEKERAKSAALEDPKAIEAKVQSRIALLEKCRRILGTDASLEDKSDEELKLSVIKKPHPDLDLTGKDQSYIDGMFEVIVAINEKTERNDSLSNARASLNSDYKADDAYEKWVEQTAKMWTMPLSSSAGYDRCK